MSNSESDLNGRDRDNSAFVTQYVKLSDSEERVNAITHGVACAIAALTSTWVLATQTLPTATMIGFAVYSASLVLVFLLSTLSHIAVAPDRLHQLRAWDQGAIYLLIAGTYTPGVLAFAEPTIAYWLLGAIWILAIFGFCSKVVVKHRVHSIDTWTYIALGWLPSMVLARGVTQDYLLWMLAGGLAYSIGVYFLLNDLKVRYYHAIWHILVVIAAAIHYYAICTLAL